MLFVLKSNIIDEVFYNLKIINKKYNSNFRIINILKEILN